MKINRRKLAKYAAGAAAGAITSRLLGSTALAGIARQRGATMVAKPSGRKIASGPFDPNWDSLKQYKTPEWFRDAKFGIWAHWTAQCVPEQGDWYARNMYIQGDDQNKYHVEHYGHPSKFGFKDIDHLWKCEHWDPEELIKVYAGTGAKYFMALANHHDNLDTYDSTYHNWNTTKVGPMKDIIGTWAPLARKQGLRFGVSNHSAHAWHWLQTAYGYDPEGPMAGVRYDAFTETKAMGAGKWWNGFDPQELYVGPSMVLPDGLKTIKEARDWHESHDRRWTEEPPPNNPGFTDTWFLRCQELVDKYDPDLLYFDDTELPLGQAGLDVTAHFYNANMQRRGGKLEAVVFGKEFKPEHAGATALDIERGRAQGILPQPWQTDTCIGDWHYNRSIYERKAYKSARTVVQMLIDIVSKNGNLCLSIPLKGDGTIDSEERKVLDGITSWLPANGEAIFGTRPFAVFGEGPPDVANTGNFNEKMNRAYTAEDIRFTTKDGKLYAMALAYPTDGKLKIKTLGWNSQYMRGGIAKVEMVDTGQALKFARDGDALMVTMPDVNRDAFAYALRITPAEGEKNG